MIFNSQNGYTDMILDGKQISKKMLEEIGKEVSQVGRVVMRGVAYEEDQESIVYFNSIKKNAEKVGIDFSTHIIKGEELMDTVQKLNNDDTVDAIIVGRPFPKGITNDMVADALDPDKDADCVTYQNMGKIYFGDETIAPATPKASIEILLGNKIDLKGKDTLIINRSVTVGRPLSQMLLNRDATVTVAHSKTRNLEDLMNRADIIFLAVGKAGYLKSSSIKSRKIVVDIGINVVDGKVRGDFEVDRENELVDYTPVPGGVGAITSVLILKNAVTLAKSR